MKEVIGQVINNFEIQEIIGEGSMGVVYRAYHPDLQRYTAIKVLRPEMIDIPDSFERFLQEARTAAQLQHENIVNVINFGADHWDRDLCDFVSHRRMVACRVVVGSSFCWYGRVLAQLVR